MDLDPIVTSVLDDDQYKASMMWGYAKLYPRARAKFKFINRGGTDFDPGFATLLKKQIEYLADLKLTHEERQALELKCPWWPPVFLDLLMAFRYDPKAVTIYQSDHVLEVEVDDWLYKSSKWEVVLMAIISELYFRTTSQPQMIEKSIYAPGDISMRAENKAKKLAEAGCMFADFGTRRRFSYKNQDRVVEALIKGGGKNFVGTSNIHLALKHGISPIGTQAHEWFMFHAAKYGFARANAMSLGAWTEVYNGELGIALSDTFTTNNFFYAFDSFHAKLWDGVRHDSGDPYNFGDKVIEHYKSLKIDPTSKTIVFSDGLDTDAAIALENYFKGKIKTAYGIGTHFTNDIGAKPLNMVIKMISAQPNGSGKYVDTVKLSDNRGKHTGSKSAIELCKQTIGITN